MERLLSAGFFTFALAVNLAVPVLANGTQQGTNPKPGTIPTQTTVNSDAVQAMRVAPASASRPLLSERDRIAQQYQTQRLIPQQ